jgi:phosphate transport system permease protein
LMLPTIIRTTEEMLRLVPSALREGSLALGAPEWKTSVSVLFPAAMNGIITGVLLAIARAAGETAPLLFTALGNERFEIGSIISSGISNKQGLLTILSRIFEQPIDSLPLTLWKYAQQPYPERVEQSWAVALVLMILVLATNITARVWIDIRKRRLQG